MEITFDAAKDEANIKKHGISLAAAAALDWETIQENVDTRKDYAEIRMIGYSVMEQRLYCVVFVRRDEVLRIISLRKANRKEVKRYEKG